MRNKTERFTAIREIISTQIVGSQDELLKILLSRGFSLTQATLSRDLKQMKVAKTPDVSGSYVYKLPAEVRKGESRGMFLSNGVHATAVFSGNIVVLHTRPGYASSIAYEIDEHAANVIIGTVAGEDTIIAVIKENARKQEVIDTLSAIIPTLTCE